MMRRLDADPRRIDWFRVLADLNRCGLPVASVSAQIIVPKSTILGWGQGAEPRYADGEALTDLWCRVTSRERRQLPQLAEMVGIPTTEG